MQKLNETLRKIEKIDHSFSETAQKRLDNLTKPPGSLGRLEDMAKKIVEITQNKNPVIKDKVIFTFAADHGVVEEGISAYPKEVTTQMIYNFLNGGAGINVLAKHVGARLVVVDIGTSTNMKEHPNLLVKKVNYGTKNMTLGPAMTREEAIKSIENGIEVFDAEFSNSKNHIDIIGTGDMGIGNTTASSAITHAITGKPAEDVTGRGTGIDDKTLLQKVNVIKRALSVNKPDASDAIDVLTKVGGFEIGGIAGLILGACSKRIPVVIDGFISGAAALIAYKLEPDVRDYIFSSHCSVEKGHKIILDYLGLDPILNLGLRLGEGTGAALGIGIIEAGVKILTQMATFEGASVSKGVDK